MGNKRTIKVNCLDFTKEILEKVHDRFSDTTDSSRVPAELVRGEK